MVRQVLVPTHWTCGYLLPISTQSVDMSGHESGGTLLGIARQAVLPLHWTCVHLVKRQLGQHSGPFVYLLSSERRTHPISTQQVDMNLVGKSWVLYDKHWYHHTALCRPGEYTNYVQVDHQTELYLASRQHHTCSLLVSRHEWTGI